MADDKRNYRYHTGIVKDVVPTKSKNAGTPCLELTIDVDEIKEGEEYVGCEPITRTVYLYFPPGSEQAREISLRKLKRAGWAGGGLQSVEKELGERRVELISFEELYNGDWKTKWDLPAGAFKSERSEDAGLTIDAILQSAPVEPGESAQPAAVGAKSSARPAAPIDDDDLPF